MALSELKERLHKKIDAIDDEIFLEMFQDMIDRKGKTFIIPERMKNGIIDSNGNFLTLEQLENKYARWLAQ